MSLDPFLHPSLLLGSCLSGQRHCPILCNAECSSRSHEPRLLLAGLSKFIQRFQFIVPTFFVRHFGRLSMVSFHKQLSCFKIPARLDKLQAQHQTESPSLLLDAEKRTASLETTLTYSLRTSQLTVSLLPTIADGGGSSPSTAQRHGDSKWSDDTFCF